jgi:hypothetical protein
MRFASLARAQVNDRWEICVSVSDGQFQQARPRPRRAMRCVCALAACVRASTSLTCGDVCFVFPAVCLRRR